MHDLTASVPRSTVVASYDLADPGIRIEPGDFLLSRAHGVRHLIIKYGQRLRIRGADKHYADYTHAALVVSTSGDVIEAVGDGIRDTSLLCYVSGRETFQVVHIESDERDRAKVVRFARSAQRAQAPYGFLTLVSITVWAFTGTRFSFLMSGTVTCSGLVARALERTTTDFTIEPHRMMPAQLAIAFEAPVPPAAARRPRKRRWTRSDGGQP